MRHVVYGLMVCLLAGFVCAGVETPAAAEGALQLPAGFSLSVYDAAGQKISVEPQAGQASLPYGDYRVQCWIFEKTDAEGEKWQLRGYPEKHPSFTIGKTPVSFQFTPEPVAATAAVVSGEDDSFSLKLTAPGGERVFVYCDGKQAPAPAMNITNADKSFNVTLSGKYG